MPFAVGESIAHYTIRGKLGQGGMGVVYKAYDGHLDRIVALKVLPHDKVAASKRRTAILSHPKWELWGQTFSPDGRWIAFHATESSQTRGVHVAPFQADQSAPPETLITVAEPMGEQARWSPDGQLLYYLSKRDGFQCLWARRLDPQTKRPVESEFPVYHSHSMRRSLGNVPSDLLMPAVIPGKIFLTQNEVTSNLWMMELPARH